jgi:hypothetical protein
VSPSSHSHFDNRNVNVNWVTPRVCECELGDTKGVGMPGMLLLNSQIHVT